MPGTDGRRSCDENAVKSVSFYLLADGKPVLLVQCQKLRYEISSHSLSSSEEIVPDIPEGDPDYNKFKEVVLEELEPNCYQLIEQALTEVELGSRKPT